MGCGCWRRPLIQSEYMLEIPDIRVHCLERPVYNILPLSGSVFTAVNTVKERQTQQISGTTTPAYMRLWNAVTSNIHHSFSL